jgi:hypothetical protein
MKTSNWIVTASAVMGIAAMAACGNSTSSTGAGGTTSGTGGAASSTTASGMTAGTGGTTVASTSASAGTGGGNGCGGATPVALTVLNVDSWCTVSIAGGAPSSLGSQTVCVADGSVTLDATANTGFKLGNWFGTTGDTGTGDPGSVTGTKSEATAAVTGTTACVSVCCPFTNGTGCPTTNSCP